MSAQGGGLELAHGHPSRVNDTVSGNLADLAVAAGCHTSNLTCLMFMVDFLVANLRNWVQGSRAQSSLSLPHPWTQSLHSNRESCY